MSFRVHHSLLAEIQLAGRCQEAIRRNGRMENRVNEEAARSSEADLDSEDQTDLRESDVNAHILEV